MEHQQSTNITYTVTLNNIKATNSDYGCCSFITIPVAIDTVTMNISQNCCSMEITLSLSSNIANCGSAVLQWYKDGVPILGATNSYLVIDFLASSNGLYEANYTTTSGLIIPIQDSYSFYLPTFPINYNWAQYQTNCCRIESEIEASNAEIHIQPNRNEGNFILNANEFTGEDVTIEVYNILGAIEYKKNDQQFYWKYKFKTTV